MKNIHILQTPNPSRFYYNNNDKKYQLCQIEKKSTVLKPNQNIYITSDEYIGLSYYLDGYLLRKGVIDDKDYWEVRKDYKKIILTTDQDLIKDGVQAIPDDFLEWFVKNPSCEEVEVEKWNNIEPNGKLSYEIPLKNLIIPKEETKTNLEKLPFPELVKEFAEYYKTTLTLKKPKQETLEEAAKKYATNHGMMSYVSQEKKLSFIDGAKWQQERSYSEEEVRKLIVDFLFVKGIGKEVGSVNEWFEQIKKK